MSDQNENSMGSDKRRMAGGSGQGVFESEGREQLQREVPKLPIPKDDENEPKTSDPILSRDKRAERGFAFVKVAEVDASYINDFIKLGERAVGDGLQSKQKIYPPQDETSRSEPPADPGLGELTVPKKREKPQPTPKQLQDNARAQALMAELGYTQKELSQLTGYSQAYLSEVKNGKNNAASPLPKHLALLVGEGKSDILAQRIVTQIASVEDNVAKAIIAKVVTNLVTTNPQSTAGIAQKVLDYIQFVKNQKIV